MVSEYPSPTYPVLLWRNNNRVFWNTTPDADETQVNEAKRQYEMAKRLVHRLVGIAVRNGATLDEAAERFVLLFGQLAGERKAYCPRMLRFIWAARVTDDAQTLHEKYFAYFICGKR